MLATVFHLFSFRLISELQRVHNSYWVNICIWTVGFHLLGDRPTHPLNIQLYCNANVKLTLSSKRNIQTITSINLLILRQPGHKMDVTSDSSVSHMQGNQLILVIRTAEGFTCNVTWVLHGDIIFCICCVCVCVGGQSKVEKNDNNLAN